MRVETRGDRKVSDLTLTSMIPASLLWLEQQPGSLH